MLGNLVVLVTGNVHGERDTVVVGKRINRIGDFTGSIRSLRGVKPRFLREVEVIKILGLVDNLSRTNHFTVVVDEDVAHDCEHPSLEVHIFYILILIVERLEGCILKEIVGIIAV